MGNKETLADLVGSYDNLNEPIPLSNRPETILGISISFQILAWISGLLRLWTRFRVIKALGWDDLFVALSLITTTLGTITIGLGATSYGLGRHFLELGGLQAMSNYIKGFYVGNGSYVMSTTFVKLALLLQYLRIFDRGSFSHRFSFCMAIFVALWGLSFTIIAWFPCSPSISAYWSLKPDVNCWGFASQDPKIFEMTFVTHGASNVVLDLIILSIPISLYFQSGVQNKTRWGLTGLLFLGAAANFASIWRLATIVKHHAATSPTFDPSWYGCVSILLAAVEVNMAVLCASMPVFWPVLQARVFQIFITKEVRVTSEERLRRADGTTERIELQYAGAMPDCARVGKNDLDRAASLRSQTGSETNLRKASTGHGSHGSSAGYCDDNYELSGDIEHAPMNGWLRPATQVSISANNHHTTK